VDTGIKLKDFIPKLEAVGVGEIVINNIDRDGKMNGYDFSLVQMVRDLTTVPMTVLGGAGSFDHIKELVSKYKIIGAAAGSLFVFKGKYKAVLISYPDKIEKQRINSPD
jgi:imidazole glycerol-phosphate synthase subunit HisF